MNLKALFGAINLALTLAPQFESIISSTVQDVEKKLAGFPGATKLAAAEAKINSLLSTVSDDLNVINDIKEILQPEINAAVALFNAAGVFKKSAAAAPATTTPPATL